MNNKSFFIVISILIVVAIISIAFYLPVRFDSAVKIKVADFPKTIGEWTSTDIPLSERDYEILETKNLIMRNYKDGKGDSLILYIIYSEDNRKVTHPPEVCYMGSGVTIVNKSPFQINRSIKATKMLVERGDFQQLVIYWYKAGNLNTDKYMEQQIKVVAGRIFGKRTSGALIRLSTDLKDNIDEKKALSMIESFCAQIEPLLAKYVP